MTVEKRIRKISQRGIEKQVTGINELRKDVEEGELEDIERVADQLFQHRNSFHDRIQDQIKEILIDLAGRGASDPFVEAAITDSNSSTRRLAVEILVESDLTELNDIQRLAHSYINEYQPSVDEIEPLLKKIDPKKIELRHLNRYEEGDLLKNTLQIVNAMDTTYFDPVLLDIYRDAVDDSYTTFSSDIREEMENHFLDHPNQEAVPLLRQTIRDGRHTKLTVESLAAQGCNQISYLIEACRESNRKKWFLDPISSFNQTELINNNAPRLLLDAVQEGDIDDQVQVIETVSYANEKTTQDLIELWIKGELPDGFAQECIRRNLHKHAIPIILDKLKETKREERFRKYQQLFERLPSDGIDVLFDELLAPEDLNRYQLEALTNGISNPDNGAWVYVNEQLLSHLEKKVGEDFGSGGGTVIKDKTNTLYFRLCTCADQVRYQGNSLGARLTHQEIFDMDEVLPRRRSLPRILIGLVDLIVQWHDGNRLDSAETLLNTLEAVGSNLLSEILHILNGEIVDDIKQYAAAEQYFGQELYERETASLLTEGENLRIEFKSAREDDDDLLQEIVSMLNTEGGTILFGVDDDGNIGGLNVDQRWSSEEEPERRLQTLVRGNIEPNPVVRAQTEKHRQEGGDVRRILRIDVTKGHEELKPYFKQNRSWVRLGSTKVKASRRHIVNLVQYGSWYRTGEQGTGEEEPSDEK